MEKLLQTTNTKLSSVASEVFGVSGRLMLTALANGVTDPVMLSGMAKGTLRKKRAELTRAFRSSFTPDDAHLLKIQLRVVDDLNQQCARIEKQIEKKVVPFAGAIELLDTIPGVNRVLAIDLIAEVGTDMSAWPSDRHFAAWTGTCPGNRESAGVRRHAPTRDGNPYIKTVLIQAAVCASRNVSSYLAARYRRLAARRGPRRAAVAVARHIAVAVYHILSNKQPYVPPRNDPKIASQQRSKHLIRELQSLGFEVTCTPIHS